MECSLTSKLKRAKCSTVLWPVWSGGDKDQLRTTYSGPKWPVVSQTQLCSTNRLGHSRHTKVYHNNITLATSAHTVYRYTASWLDHNSPD